MADHRAVSVVCDAVVQLLRSHVASGEFDRDLQFRVLTARQFREEPITAGVSLFLYRVTVNGSPRLPRGRVGADGLTRKHPLPVDLHFLLSVWGTEASLQHRIAGWMMRVLEDYPILAAGLLNRVTPGAFRPEETVQLCPAEMAAEELLRLWENLIEGEYHLTVPYMARVVQLDSLESRDQTAPPVEERRFDYATAAAEGS